jgi:hypothetical protein
MESVPRTAGGSRLVVVVRVVLVVLAAGAAVAAFVVSRGHEPTAMHRYVCPMHSEVTAASPGDCPICGMALEQVDAASRAAMLRDPAAAAEQVPFASLRVSYEASNLMRFSVAQVRRNALPGEVFAPAIAGAGGQIVAQLYRDELASLAPDELAEFTPAAGPGAPIKIRRDATAPVIEDATARVGFHVEPGGSAPPGQVGWVKLGYKVRAMLIVRSAAILYAADGPYVLTFSAQRGGLSKRRIEIGKDYSGMTAVVSGLRDKEFVMMANAFSLDAERRLQAAP